MSTPHDILRTALNSIAPYYPGKFPQESGAPTWPAIRGTIVSRQNDPDQCGGGLLTSDTVRVQIDVCAVTYTAVEGIMSSVVTALDALTNPQVLREPGGFDAWDAEAKVHRMSADFLILQSTPI